MASRIERKREAGTAKAIRSDAFVVKRTSYGVVISKFADVKRFARGLASLSREKARN